MASVNPGETSAKLGNGGKVSFAVLSRALALSADTDHAQQMLRDLEAMLGSHGVLECFQFGRKELDDSAALGADHVIVVLMFVVVFVVRAAVAKTNFAREARFGQELERAIDGGLADGRVLSLHQPVEVFDREMFFGTQKNIQNQVTLRRTLQPPLLDVFKKDFLLFS